VGVGVLVALAIAANKMGVFNGRGKRRKIHTEQ
jgi:hypothetical protein